MQTGFAVGRNMVTAYTVPTGKNVADLHPDLDEFRRGEDVTASGFVLGVLEDACMRALRPYLEDTEAIVGKRFNLEHLAPTAAGAELTVHAVCCRTDFHRQYFEFISSIQSVRTGRLVARGLVGTQVVNLARFQRSVIHPLRAVNSADSPPDLLGRVG